MGVARGINYFQFGIANKEKKIVEKLPTQASLVFFDASAVRALCAHATEIGVEPPGIKAFETL
jgi:hypothetical protein